MATPKKSPKKSASPKRTASPKAGSPKKAKKAGGKKGAKKGSPKKKSDKPRAPNPFMKFASEHRPSIMKANPSWKVTEIGQELGKRWRALSDSEKATYKQ